MGEANSKSADFYADPSIYDILHAPGTADDVRGLIRVVESSPLARVKGAWLEPACGTGRFLRAVARWYGRRSAERSRFRGIGFDLSPAMVAYADERAAGAGLAKELTHFVADMRDFESAAGTVFKDCRPKVAVAFNLINTIRHLETDAAMVAHLRAVGRVLARGGRYIVGLTLSAYGIEEETEDVWVGARGRCKVTQVVQYLPPTGSRGDAARVERVISHMTVERPRGVEHIDSTYGLRGYNLKQWRDVTAKGGLAIEAVHNAAGEPVDAHEPGYYLFTLAPA